MDPDRRPGGKERVWLHSGAYTVLCGQRHLQYGSLWVIIMRRLQLPPAQHYVGPVIAGLRVCLAVRWGSQFRPQAFQSISESQARRY